MTVYSIIGLLGGLALFLYGMRLMGDGLKTSNSAAMQKVLTRVTNNPFTAFLMGVAVTALIQSSTATIVLVAGLVGAGLLTLRQSIGIVLGANVGTTVTGQVIRLLDLNSSGATDWLNFFKPDNLAPLAALIGIILIMFIKARSSNTAGSICMGFGILFTGLINMTAAVAPLSESPAFISLFTRFSGTPILGFLCGTLVSTIVQSSSASVGMLQTLSTTGVLTFSSIYPILVGIYLGDAVTTAIVCSIGTRADTRRTGLVTVLFNVFSILFIMLGVTLAHSFGWLEALWDRQMTSGSIANTNSLFKLAAALVCIPATGLFYRLAVRLVHDDVKSGDIVLDAVVQKLSDKLFLSPKMALDSARDVTSVMLRFAGSNTASAMQQLNAYDPAKVDAINEKEDCIDRMADAVDAYLIRFSPHILSAADSEMLNYYLQCYAEAERIGDHAANLQENAEALSKQSGELSDDALAELGVLSNALDEILEISMECFSHQDMAAAAKIEPLEEVIDDLVAEVKRRHIQRLREGRCTSYIGLIFVDALTNIERISDQCSNIAVYTQAIHNSELMNNRHEYIQKLHEGGNEDYNREYSRQRGHYMGLIEAIH